MPFASFVFLFWFLPLLLVLLHVAWPRPLRQLVLLAGGVLWSGWWLPGCGWLLIACTVVDWWWARRIAADRSRATRVLQLALGCRIAVFAVCHLALLPGAATWGQAPAWLHFVLPLGLTVNTLQAIGHLLDVHRGRQAPARSPFEQLCGATLFALLPVGPIVPLDDLQPAPRRPAVDWRRFADGLVWFSFGLGKQVLLGAQIAPLVEAAFTAREPGLCLAWIGAVGFALQLWCELSGGLDMACGLGRMCGFETGGRGRAPFRAASLGAFWRAWHPSLWRWTRDHLASPLRGRALAWLAIAAVLAVCHGAGGMLGVAFGAVQAAGLAAERSGRGRALAQRLPALARVAATFVVVVVSLVALRADGLADGTALWRGMLGWQGIGAAPALSVPTLPDWLALAVAAVFAFRKRPRAPAAAPRPTTILAAAAVLLLAVAEVLSGSGTWVPFRF